MSCDDNTQVEQLARQLRIPHAPVLYRGKFSSVKQIEDWMVKAAQLPSKLAAPTVPGDKVPLYSELI